MFLPDSGGSCKYFPKNFLTDCSLSCQSTAGHAFLLSLNEINSELWTRFQHQSIEFNSKSLHFVYPFFTTDFTQLCTKEL